MATYVDVNGQRVAPAVAYDLARMAAAFKADTGYELFCSSGTRTWQVQYNLWLAYQRDPINNPRAAHPDDPKAYHCEVNPTGPRAVDLRDSGPDAGVTRRGSARDKWMERNASRFNFENEGYLYGEAWHKVWRGGDPFAVVGGGAGGEAMDETAKQQFLVSLGLDTGGVGNGWGPMSEAATRTFQGWVGLTQDGDFGIQTTLKAKVIMAGGKFVARAVDAIQTFLKSKGLYGGAIDNQWGNQSSLGTYRYQAGEGLAADAQWGPATDARAFPVVVTPPPPPTPTVDWNVTTRPDEEVLARLRELGFEGDDPVSMVKAFQASRFIVQDGSWGRTSDGLAFPPPGSIHGVDYSFARPDPAMLAERGVKLAGRYLWPARYATKGITRSELEALNAAGIEVFFIYEEDGKELIDFNSGVRVAKIAEDELGILGLSDLPVYFNVDYDAGADKMPGILSALDGIASVIGYNRTGLYSGYGPMKAAFDAEKITWGFQTYAWSGGQWDSRAQLQQWSNGQWGGSVDFTRAMVPEFGQTPVVVSPPPPPPGATVTVEVQELLELGGRLLDLAGGAT